MSAPVPPALIQIHSIAVVLMTGGKPPVAPNTDTDLCRRLSCGNVKARDNVLKT